VEPRSYLVAGAGTHSLGQALGLDFEPTTAPDSLIPGEFGASVDRTC